MTRPTRNSGVTIRAATERALAVAKANRRRPSTVRSLRETGAKLEEVFGADHALAAMDVTRFLGALDALAPLTVNRHLRALRRICRLSDVSLRFDYLRTPRPKVTVLAAADLDKLLAAVTPRLRSLLVFLAHSGLRRAEACGLAAFAAHDLRRTYVSTLLDRGVDLSLAADLAGNTSPMTTKRYDRRGERARHAAAAALVVPFTVGPLPVRADPATKAG